MLYSPSQYGGITAQTNTSHLMHDDAFCDSLPPAVSNPSGGATLQTALSCITGNKNTVKKTSEEHFSPADFTTPMTHSCISYIYVCMWKSAGFDVHSQTQEVLLDQDMHGGDFFNVADHCTSQVSYIFTEG